MHKKQLSLKKTLENEQLQLSRRKVLKSFMAFGILTQIPLNWSCNSFSENKSSVFSRKQIEMVQRIQQILFPDDGFGPGAFELKADRYLEWVLSDIRLDKEDKEYIFNGLKWVEETADEDFNTSFLSLDNRKQEKLVQNIARTDWGENWLSMMLTYILEALLADPQYGGNPEQKGWKWLSHYPGYPRPTEVLLYPEIFNTLKNEYKQKV